MQQTLHRAATNQIHSFLNRNCNTNYNKAATNQIHSFLHRNWIGAVTETTTEQQPLKFIIVTIGTATETITQQQPSTEIVTVIQPKPIDNIETQQKCCKAKKTILLIINHSKSIVRSKTNQQKQYFAELVRLNPAIGNLLTTLRHSNKSAVRS